MGNFLLTGAAGFIASKVAERLLSEGHSVIGVDNLNNSYDVRLKQWRLSLLSLWPRFEFLKMDITNRRSFQAIGNAVKNIKIDAVLNLAARSGVPHSVTNPWVYLETNINGTLNMLELCREFKIDKFIQASSSSVYGKHNTLPLSEDADTELPLSPYAASKKGAEVLCHTYHHLFGIDVTIFRYFTVYGPAGRPDMSLFRFIHWIYEGEPVKISNDGRQTRGFTYVDDIARGTIAGLRRVGYQIVNLGSDRPVVLLDAIMFIEEIIGLKAKLEFEPANNSDIPAIWANVGRAEQLFGWRPSVAFKSGIGLMINWYQENRKWASRIRIG